MREIVGDILEVLPPGGVMFHQVNTLGKFGAGLALQIRRKWPLVYECYHSYWIRRHELSQRDPDLGDYCGGDVDGDEMKRAVERRTVMHIFAQKTIGGPGCHTNYTALANALRLTAAHHARHDCYFPHGMGCGLAGGNWEFVKILIEENFPEATIVRLP